MYRGLAHALATLSFRSPVEPIAPTRTLRYVTGARRGIEPLADVYEPVRPNGRSIVLVHGGGFVLGSRRAQAVRYLATRFAAAGFEVCAIDYRMIFRGGRLSDAVDDVCAAFTSWPRDGASRDRATWRFSGTPAAPTLLIHGDADELVPVEQARRLVAQRTALGLPTRLVQYPGARHGFFNTAHRAAEDAVHEIVRFVS